jgi:hypothetical protein
MTEKGKGNVEILVHTSAPSRGKDDAHYRALASAYLLFEPVTRLNLYDENANNQLSASQAHVLGQSRSSLLKSAPEEVQQGPNTFIDLGLGNIYDVSQSQGQVLSRSSITRSNARLSLESPQASFSSVLDNLDSPVLLRTERIIKTPPPPAKRKTDQMLVTECEPSWETPPSVIPDSQSTYNRAIPQFSSPTRVLELYLQHFDTSGSVSADADAGGGSQLSDASSINLILASSQPQTSSPPQTTPPVAPSSTKESPQIIRDTPYSEHHRYSKSPRVTRKKVLSQQKSATSSGARCGFPGPPRYHVLAADLAQQPEPCLSRPTSQTSPQRKRQKVEVPGTIVKPIQRKPSKLIFPPRITPDEIHPPPPRTSSWGPKSPLIITPALAILATQLELPKRFRPKTQTRPLRDLERGYWAIEMGTWSSVLREQAWGALGAYLEQGRAGWGIWALKCDARKNGAGAGSGGEQLGLRVYCWGGVAGHVYLLLYLVSQRRVNGTGARWVDGGGQAVVLMP